jgi:TM2 domain-containing membrane protein YozV
VANEWWYAKDEQRLGPVSWDELKSMAQTGTLQPGDLVWKDGMPDWQAAIGVPGLMSTTSQTAYSPVSGTLDPALRSEVQNKKLAAGICGILLNCLGIHKFILGMNTAGVIMLVVSVVGACLTAGIGTVVMTVIGIVEGVIYLTKSDEEFYQTYMVQKKEWF